MPGVLPLDDDSIESPRQQEGDQPVVRVVFARLPKGGAGVAQRQGTGAPQLAKAQPGLLAQVCKVRYSLPAIGAPGRRLMAEQHEAGAPVRGREAGKTGPLRGLQGPHGDIQLLACHEVKGPGPGEVAKCGLKIGAAEDLAGQCHVQPAEFAIGLDLAEGWPVAPGHRQCLFGAQRQVRCEQQAEAQCAVNSGLDMFPDQAEPPCSVSWIPEYESQGGTGPGERHHRHSAPP
ncbi:hypothetical protein D3C81_841030 [compost metagenome]